MAAIIDWIKGLGKKAPAPSAGESAGTTSKEYLDGIRESELSVGASMRRGEPVAKAPGQPSRPASAWDRIGDDNGANSRAQAASRTSRTPYRPSPTPATSGGSTSDFAFLAAGMAIGSNAMCDPDRSNDIDSSGGVSDCGGSGGSGGSDGGGSGD
jgi:hypothetical protein